MIAIALWTACSAPKVEPPPPDAPDAAEIPTAPVQPGLLSEAEFAALHELRDDAAPVLKGAPVQVGDMNAYLSLPEGATGPVPGIVVVHEWWGLNDHIRHWADRLAAQGYAALAVDLYGGTVATSPDAAMAAMKQVDEATALSQLRAAHAFLATDARVQAPRTGAIGWCFGGGWSLKLALAEPKLDAAVMYYGRLVSDDAALQGLGAPLLGIFGERDKGIPAADVRAFQSQLQTLGKSAEFHLYDADHAFGNPSSARYDAPSATAAWGEVQAFLATHLAGS